MSCLIWYKQRNYPNPPAAIGSRVEVLGHAYTYVCLREIIQSLVYKKVKVKWIMHYFCHISKCLASLLRYNPVPISFGKIRKATSIYASIFK